MNGFDGVGPFSEKSGMRKLSFIVTLTVSAALYAGEPADAHFYVRKANDPAVVHADAKIRWRSVSPETFQDAERLGKPLFLFVTTEWLKAGKEMERATFGDVEIATRLNEEFIPVKIDRDAHPGLDFRLQQAVAAVSGVRGWPLCAIATPEGHVFAGGTSFPADDDPVTQKPGLRGIIFQVIKVLREQRDDADKAGRALSAELAKTDGKPALTEVPADLLKGVTEGLAAEQENTAGRPVGTIVRFPAPRALLGGLIWAERTKDEALRARTLKQIDEMLSGGIYDCLDQGFFRCAVDGNWRVPRFEKLLVQNAEMMRVLFAAWQLTGDGRYLHTMALPCGWVSRRLKAGELYSNALAGGANEFSEGDFYTWSVAEVEALIPDEGQLELFRKAFDIGELGDLPVSAPHRNVLPNAMFSVLNVSAIAKAMKTRPDVNEVETNLHSLRQAQAKRPAPERSRVVCVDSNALFALAMIESGIGYSKERSWADEGLARLRELLKISDVHALSADGKVLSKAQLSDEAAVSLACAAAFEATGDAEFERQGVLCLERIESAYLDAKDNTFFDRPAGAGEFAAARGRVKIYADTWEPSPMGLAAQAFLKWSALLDRPAYWMRAKQCVLGCGEITEGLGHYGASLATAADWLKHGGVTVTVVSKPNAPEGDALRLAAQSVFAPGKAVKRAAMPDAAPGIDVAKTVAYAVIEKNGKRVLTSDAETLKKAMRE